MKEEEILEKFHELAYLKAHVMATLKVAITMWRWKPCKNDNFTTFHNVHKVELTWSRG